jgi:hypothetical protein
MSLKPKIVCLCGSTRFYEEFLNVTAQETLNGNIVVSVGVFGHRPELYSPKISITDSEK